MIARRSEIVDIRIEIAEDRDIVVILEAFHCAFEVRKMGESGGREVDADNGNAGAAFDKVEANHIGAVEHGRFNVEFCGGFADVEGDAALIGGGPGTKDTEALLMLGVDIVCNFGFDCNDNIVVALLEGPSRYGKMGVAAVAKVVEPKVDARGPRGSGRLVERVMADLYWMSENEWWRHFGGGTDRPPR